MSKYPCVEGTLGHYQNAVRSNFYESAQCASETGGAGGVFCRDLSPSDHGDCLEYKSECVLSCNVMHEYIFVTL